jgi:hypothetical protein
MAQKLHSWGEDNVDTLLTLVREAVLKSSEYLHDQVFTAIPLLDFMYKKGKITMQGGASILVPLMFGKNSTFKAYSGDDVIDTTGTEGLTMAQQPWRNMAGTVTLVGDELRKIAGPEKLKDYAQAKIMQAMMSARDSLAVNLWKSAQGAKDIVPLPLLVDSTGTIMEIASDTSSWWASQETAGGDFTTRGISDMRTLRNNLSKQGQSGVRLPDYVCTTQTIHELYEASQLPSYRYGPSDSPDASKPGLKWSSTVVEFDPNCPSGELYMLNSEYMGFVVHSAADFKMGEFKEPTDQDVKSAKILWMGNTITTNRRRLGKITGIS